MDKGKVIEILELCTSDAPIDRCLDNHCPYFGGKDERCCFDYLMKDALELLKLQNEIIDDLIKVGYPHNFQREEPWIVNYMYAITDVIRKAVNLRNDAD